MQINFIRNPRVNRLAVSVLFACCFFLLTAGAQSSDRASEITKVGTPAVIGLAHGDVLRFSAFNPQPPDERGEPVRMQMWLYDAHGNAIATSAEVVIPPGEFRFVEFKRDDLPIAGEPGTGLLQVRTQPLWGLRANYRVNVSTSLEATNTTTPGNFRYIIIVEALP